MRDPEPEPLLFALAMIGLGILTLLYGDFAVIWQPVAKDIPWRQGFAYVSGAALLLGGIGLFFRRTASPSAVGLAIYLLMAWVLPQAVKVVPAGADFIGRWLGFCETVAVLCGAWLLYYPLPRPGSPTIAGRNGMHLARLLFGASCVLFGLSHFIYADFTAGMIPAWMPVRLPLAYFTGAGHLAAGAAILFGLFPRLGATLEAVMMSSFVLLVHVPPLFADPAPAWAPTGRIQWTALFWAGALAASAWIVARSLRDRSWGRIAAREDAAAN